MKEVGFGPPSGPEHHPCTSTRDGDWIIFRCGRCPDYERRMNWRTGASQVHNPQPDFQHSGHHVPFAPPVESPYVH